MPVIPERLVKEHKLSVGPLMVIKDKQKFGHHYLRGSEQISNRNKDAVKSGLLINDKQINYASKLNKFKKMSSVDKCNNTKFPDIYNND